MGGLRGRWRGSYTPLWLSERKTGPLSSPDGNQGDFDSAHKFNTTTTLNCECEPLAERTVEQLPTEPESDAEGRHMEPWSRLCPDDLQSGESGKLMGSLITQGVNWGYLGFSLSMS